MDIEQITKAVRMREEAKKKQNWDLADDIQSLLAKMNIVLHDCKRTGLSYWRVKEASV